MSLTSVGSESSSSASAKSDEGSDSPPAAAVLRHPSAGRGTIAQGRGGRHCSTPGRGCFWANHPWVGLSGILGDTPAPVGTQVRPVMQRRGDYGALDHEERDILDDIWPGVSDSSLLTRFISCHFAGDVEAYVPFSWWADSRVPILNH
jgi:hypothetical protein